MSAGTLAAKDADAVRPINLTSDKDVQNELNKVIAILENNSTYFRQAPLRLNHSLTHLLTDELTAMSPPQLCRC